MFKQVEQAQAVSKPQRLSSGQKMSFPSPTGQGLTKKLPPIRRDPVPEIPCTVTYCGNKGRNTCRGLSSGVRYRESPVSMSA